MLSYLVYTSKKTSICDEAAVNKILESCQRNNNHHEITGVLLHSSDRFIQYIEGDYQEIKALYNKIKEDERHEQVMTISMGQVKERCFPSWAMGSKNLQDDSVQFESSMSKEEQTTYAAMLNGDELTDNKAVNLIKRLF